MHSTVERRQNFGLRERIDHVIAESQAKARSVRELQSHRFHDTILSNTPDHVYVLDTNHRFTYANQALLTTWGKTWDQAIGKSIQEMGYPRWLAELLDREIDRVIATKQPVRGEIPFNGTHGQRIYDYIFVPVIGTQGEVEAIAGTTRDITERKEVERKLLNLNQDLERKIEERTRQLHQKEQEFLQAMKLEAIARLAGGIAHDFNNLLTGIAGISEEMLAVPQMPESYRGDLRQILEASRRASNLTRQLLAFGRQQKTSPIVVGLNSVVSGIEGIVRRLIGEDIRLIVDISPHTGNINADPSQMEQVILNLIINARDAMPQGGTLTLQTSKIVLDGEKTSSYTESELPSGSYAVLSVEDTGIGMDEATKARLFEPFFTTKPKGKGSGLGLAMVYGIVKQAHGYVKVLSEPGRGTTFKLFIPSVTEEAHVDRRLEPRDMPRGHETVLVVEDEDIVRRVVTRALKQLGYKVLEARDPQEALAISETEPHIDMLLSDVVMPGMSGREVAQRILMKRPEIKILLMSGYEPAALMERYHMGQNEEFIEKTFTVHALSRKIRDVLDRPPLHAIAASA
jgi:PAS domain S-box-containing protein